MVDFIYSVIRRPIANQPDKKDIYHVDKTPKDARAKKIEDDDPKKDEQPKRSFSDEHEHSMDQQSENNEQKNNGESSLSKTQVDTEIDSAGHQPKFNCDSGKVGRGKYIDENGNARLDFYA